MGLISGERYAEIGLLGPIGGRPFPVFLFESMILTILEGGLGVTLGLQERSC